MFDTKSCKWEEIISSLLNECKRDKRIISMLSEIIHLTSGKGTSIKPRKRKEPLMNPLKIFSNSGEAGLRKELASLNHLELQDIIKSYGLDPSKKSHKWKNVDRLIELIIERVRSKSSHGEVFNR